MLKQIEYETCPCCKSVAIQWSREADTFNDKKYRQHAHGGVWERVRFACGRVDEAAPYPVHVRTVARCPKEPEIVKRIESRLKAVQDLEKVISVLQVDDAFRGRIAESLRSVSPKLFL